ncbi:MULTISPECIES: ATP-grasp domain-containing protein [unclassified Bradyrhizobium]|uniref:ATP-grasp domain-containing protein n=1 Tax=unclassified Bradyrhizobium TaxID=2631580 RepID=UPI001FFAF7A0|nr:MULTISPECIES: ATP-grasp domain-containing protein [unclassified Bradyrhizobium]MCK1333371.1 ATP-grasp domain-containing protein [Bradyrhizobium sp. CW9]MCK1471206.1 ATP-grasp domain-containing protein [Bradyrhizobium sp. CW10]MCK1484343.1 ATP-grasp domain-containing protein [Bradyrhizobium sp. 193]MCK1612702.1 ATP-grasp domain-containing protein [Bradyrhizobium sp. 163]MCK1675035.1 ATP-grasp domain-containing protein [Bradyrhizobium sp. 150]
MTEFLLYINYRRLIRESIRAFEAAHRLGYRVAVLGQPLPPELACYVDEWRQCNPASLVSLESAVEEIRKCIQIAGVVCFTETAVEACAIVAAKLRLPGLPHACVSAVRDKSILRERTQSVSGLTHRLLQNDSDLEEFISVAGLPVIVKPVNASGSTGIYLLREPADLNVFHSTSKKIGNPSYDPTLRRETLTFLAERYIGGQEVSVEGYVCGGEVTVVGITHKLTSDPYCLEVRHIFPADLDGEMRSMIEAKTKDYVLALCLDNASFHLEGKYDGPQFALIEVAARPGGDYIASHLVPLALHYDFYENLARIAVGTAPLPPPAPQRVAGIHYVLAKQEGRLLGYRGLEAVLDHPWVEQAIVETSIGTHIVLPPSDFRLQRLIAVISTAPSQALLTKHLDWVSETITPVFALE